MTNKILHSIESDYTGKKVLVTGANGFVSAYLIPLLKNAGASVIGVGLQPEAKRPVGSIYEYRSCDLRDLSAVRELIQAIQPDIVFHLASQSSVGTSWTSEWQTIESNVQTSHNLMKSLEQLTKPVQVLAVSSGEVYGNQATAAKTNLPLKPLSPYAVSKAMMEVLLHRFANTNISFVIARSFTHTGAGRPARFFEASIASQIAQALREKKSEMTLQVGNLDVIRDYSDVREVALKYLWLAVKGNKSEAYNVCSGEGFSLSQIIQMIADEAKTKVITQTDTSRLRKNDIPYLVGENSLKEIFPAGDFPVRVALKELLQSFQ